jgi:hypothetical protein
MLDLFTMGKDIWVNGGVNATIRREGHTSIYIKTLVIMPPIDNTPAGE